MPHQNNPFPAWRLPEGIISANEGDLERSIGSCERWEWGGGGLVVFGVIITVFIAALHPAYDSFWEQWGSAVAEGLVAIGVIVEIGFSSMAGLRQSELIRRSRERAEIANLEAEKLRSVASWRTLTRHQHEALVLALKNSGPGASLKFCVLMNDQESLSFAYKISHPLRSAGWSVGFQFESYLHDIFTGLMIPEPADNCFEIDRVVRGRLRDAFISAEIAFVNGWPSEPYVSQTDNAALTAPIAWLYVGPKPPPML